uniref:Uncharacterized protein n=1 Tax=Arundo donax TaxID=35708 RepID=A0A0A9EF54_ARUDO
MAKMHQAVQGKEMLQHDDHQEVLQHHDVEQAAVQVAGQEMLKRCKYLVMGKRS